MTRSNSHLIHSQVLELELTSAGRAMDVQEEAARPFRDAALPAVEALFDRIAGPERIARVDRLEIDLGDLVGADWREQLIDRLVARLSRSLESGVASGGLARVAEPPSIHHPEDGAFSTLLFYLEHGRLPWWGRRPRASWSEELGRSPTADGWRRLADLVRRDRGARARLAREADDSLLEALVRAAGGPPRAGEIVRWLAPARAASTSDAGRSEPRVSRARLWRLVIASAVRVQGAPDPGPALVADLLAEYRAARGDSGTRTSSDSAVEATSMPRPTDSGLPPPWSEWLAAVEAGPAPSRPEKRESAAEALDANEVGETGAERGRQDGRPAADPLSPRDGVLPQPRPAGEADRTAGAGSEAGTPVDGVSGAEDPAVSHGVDEAAAAAPQAASERATEAPSEAVHVAGAGAVLLHPFLEELFASRELLEERAFRDAAARGRAVSLLSYLTFGDLEVAEYDLLLAKTLCGMPWEEPVSPSELSPDDTAACDELLAAVLGHWEALNSASVPWLRERFLLREGRLEPVDGGRRMTVDRQAQDVLLARIPWGVGLIRLPWMTELLYVSWAD